MKIKLNPDQEIVSTIGRTQAHRRILSLPRGAHGGKQMYVSGI